MDFSVSFSLIIFLRKKEKVSRKGRMPVPPIKKIWPPVD